MTGKVSAPVLLEQGAQSAHEQVIQRDLGDQVFEIEPPERLQEGERLFEMFDDMAQYDHVRGPARGEIRRGYVGDMRLDAVRMRAQIFDRRLGIIHRDVSPGEIPALALTNDGAGTTSEFEE